MTSHIVQISKGMDEGELIKLLGEPSQKVKGGRALVVDTQNWSESEYLERYSEDEVNIECWIWSRPEASYTVTLNKHSRTVTNVRTKLSESRLSRPKSQPSMAVKPNAGQNIRMQSRSTMLKWLHDKISSFLE